MNSNQRACRLSGWILGASAALTMLPSQASWAQQTGRTKAGAAVIVEGVVREVFRSDRRTQTDFLIQIEVQRSEYGRGPASPRRAQAPAPGDQIYVHVSQSNDNQDRSGRPGRAAIPAERTQIRAYLDARAEGGWEGALPDWFDQVSPVAADRGPTDPEPPAGAEAVPDVTAAPAPPPAAGANTSILQKLGIRAEQVRVSGRLILKILDVLPEGPAGKAGIEPGDALIGINGGVITDLDQLATAIRQGGPESTFTVLNHRDGQSVPVKVNVSRVVATELPTTDARAQSTPTRTLGVKTEQVRVGQRPAVRVTAVQEDSPAARAGIEPGDVLVEANGKPIGDLSQLQTAVQRGGPAITLKVLDSRTRREVEVKVQFGAGSDPPAGPGAPATDPLPTPSPAPGPSRGSLSARALGLTVEAGTVDLLPVVKVVRVQQGSPAARAGIEPGDAIVGLNDKVIFAPDLLDEVLKTAGPEFTLSVLDPKSGKKTPVKIALSGQEP